MAARIRWNVYCSRGSRSMTMLVLTGALAGALLAGNVFSMLDPTITLSDADRRNLDRGATVARTLRSGDGQVGVFAITRIDVQPATLIAHARAIESLKRSRFVTAIRRFSDPPRIEDLDELVLSPRERQAALECTVRKCLFKFTEAEIVTLRAAVDGAVDREAALSVAFRRLVLARATAHHAVGVAGLPDIANRSTPVETFLYWAQETYGAGKPVVIVNHVGLFAPSLPGAPAIVVSRQVFASHYMTGGQALTAITTDTATGAKYLVYVNRTGVDLLGGMLGPVKRAVLESRLKGDLPDIIQRLRAHLERTPPPTH
jgi:hypothetical protein